MEGEFKLDKYFNSFFNVPGKFATIRKNVNFILGKILKENYDKINFIEPDIKIINLSFSFTSNLKKDLNKNIIHDIEKGKIRESIMKKLEVLEDILTKYKNHLNRKTGKEKIENINYPIIILSNEEKDFIKENTEIKPRVFKKRRIEKKENIDNDFQIILDYLFNLKEIENQILHINDEEKIQYYLFSKSFIEHPRQNYKEDKIKDCLKNVQQAISIIPKLDKLTYGDLVDYTFNGPINKFLVSNDRINYLLNYLNIKRRKLGDINDKYENFEKKIEKKMNKICILSKKIEEENDNNKYNQFIKKYEIKKDYDIIIGYLNNLVTYILPDSNNQKNNTKEKKESDDEEEVDAYESEKKRKEEILNKEKILRNSIQLLFNKEEKFMEYIEIYLKYHFNKYINESKNNIEEKIKKK